MCLHTPNSYICSLSPVPLSPLPPSDAITPHPTPPPLSPYLLLPYCSYATNCNGVARYIGVGVDGSRHWACGKHKLDVMAKAGTCQYQHIFRLTASPQTPPSPNPSIATTISTTEENPVDYNSYCC